MMGKKKKSIKRNNVLINNKRNSYPDKKVDVQAYMSFLDATYNHMDKAVKNEIDKSLL